MDEFDKLAEALAKRMSQPLRYSDLTVGDTYTEMPVPKLTKGTKPLVMRFLGMNADGLWFQYISGPIYGVSSNGFILLTMTSIVYEI